MLQQGARSPTGDPGELFVAGMHRLGAEWLTEVFEQRFSESELMAIDQALTLLKRVVEL